MPNDLETMWAELTRDGGVRRLLQLAREEDLGPPDGPGDITSRVTVEARSTSRAAVSFRRGGHVAGLRALPMILEVFGCASRVALRALVADGHPVEVGAAAAYLEGPTRDLLAVERTMLNLIGRLSGIATRTHAFVELIAGTSAKLMDTRKTTPGLRNLEKYAVRCGGGRSHRLGLFDAVLIKDNHLAGVPLDAVADLVSAAAAKGRAIAAEHGAKLRFVECEVDRLEQLEVILHAGGCGIDVVLLDNMDLSQLGAAVAMRTESGVSLELEASGGVSEQTVRAIAETGVDRISVGGLTHQAVSLDVGLDFE